MDRNNNYGFNVDDTIIFINFFVSETFPMLQKLVEFEKSTGLEFKHIRLLAR